MQTTNSVLKHYLTFVYYFIIIILLYWRGSYLVRVKRLDRDDAKLYKASKQKIEKLEITSFTQHLQDTEGEFLKERLEDLLLDIDKQSKVLSEILNFDELRKYKELVKNFMQEVTKRTYKLEERRIFDKSGKKKIFNVIKKINERLDELTNIFINKEIDKLQVLEKLGEIKGLLIDLIG